MLLVFLASIAFGLLWNVLAVRLIGGGLKDAMRPSRLVAGALAGMAAGYFTLWSRSRRDGRERILDVIATYYLAIVVYWLGFAVVERAMMCTRHGGWTSFDLGDHMRLLVSFILYGTVGYGLFLMPLTFLTRVGLWKLYSMQQEGKP